MIPAFGRLRREDLRFKVNLDYIVRSCLREKKKSKILFYVVQLHILSSTDLALTWFHL
jgi:hypothetical protein